MKLEDADRILDEYGEVLVAAIKLWPCAPESMLPYSKGQIKEAIKSRLAFTQLVDVKNEEYIDLLEGWYTLLAHFVPDETAEWVRGLLKEMRNKASITIKESEAVDEAIDWLKGRVNSGEWKQYVSLLEKLKKETSDLLEEFKKWRIQGSK